MKAGTRDLRRSITARPAPSRLVAIAQMPSDGGVGCVTILGLPPIVIEPVFSFVNPLCFPPAGLKKSLMSVATSCLEEQRFLAPFPLPTGTTPDGGGRSDAKCLSPQVRRNLGQRRHRDRGGFFFREPRYFAQAGLTKGLMRVTRGCLEEQRFPTSFLR